MCRNLAQSLFQYGQVETTLAKAKEVRPFAEKLITLARKDSAQSRRRVAALLGDRSFLDRDQEEKYEAMTEAQRRKVLVARSGRRHRAGKIPAGYNKKKIPFVASSIVHKLVTDVAPRYADRPGGYTRIIRLPKRRIGDNSDLALLQLVGLDSEEAPPASGTKKKTGLRRQKARDRARYLSGKKPARQRRRGAKGSKAAAPTSKTEAASAADADPQSED